MAEKSGRRAQLDRGVAQAIVSLKKGAYLLKCGRRGKPKFCAFRLSTDEKSLIWYSGEKEKCLKLDTISRINLGQKTDNFHRPLQPEKVSQSFSLVYQNSERSLDLICKDKEQAECWVLGLTYLLSVSDSDHPRPLSYLRTGRAAKSCVNSPISHLSTKCKSKFILDSEQLPQVYTVYGSSPRKVVKKYVSEGFLDTSNILYSLRERTLSNVHHLIDEKLPSLSHTISEGFKSTKDCYQKKVENLISPDKIDSLQDVFIWGGGVGIFFVHGSNFFETNEINSNVLLPKLLESTQTLNIRSISCGEKHVALVTKQGEAFCWGEGSGGKLGHKVNIDMAYPKAIESLSSSCVQAIACGSTQTCAITRSGELYTWGKGCFCDNGERSHWIPHRVSSLSGEIKISKVACGEWHTAIVSSLGHLFTYGEGTFGALGHGNLQSSSQPKEVESLKGLRVMSVACGQWHTAAIVEVVVNHFKSNSLSGKLFTWGDSDKGRLGHDDKERKLFPTCIASLVDYDFVQVSCGRTLTVALTITGLVITMGSVMNRQLINARGDDASVTMVEGCLKDEYVKEISSGSFHVAVLTTNGSVYTWGKGKNGQLGLGDTKDRYSPSLVEALENRNVQSVVCGFNFTTAICRHKSLSRKDKSLCTSCQMAFGFTRRKHKCYNCGFAFCNLCSNKRALNASLDPNKTRRCRVCDQCYARLEIPIAPKFNDIANQSEYSISGKGVFPSSIQDKKNKGSSFSGVDQKWGQVSCPPQFKKGIREESILFVTKSKEGVLDDAHVNVQHDPKSLKQDLPHIDELLTEELQLLHAKAKTLSQECRRRSVKLQQYKQRIEETCLLARDQAAKFEADKSIINVLRIQVNALSETVIVAGQEKERTLLVDNELTEGMSDPLGRVNAEKESNSVISESSSVPCNGRFKVSSFYSAAIEARICSLNGLKHEWVEQFELGVYITFTILPNGQRGLKRVRFSRKRFSEKEAEKWWKENHSRIFGQYCIDSIDASSAKKTASYTSTKCLEEHSCSNA